MQRKSPSLPSHLDDLYACYNRREFVHPDPVEFLYDYHEVRDREIAALIASSLAYGNVKQILRSVGAVLRHMPSPGAFLERESGASLKKIFSGFRHRFTPGTQFAGMLYGIKRLIETYDSLETCFREGYSESDETILPALAIFVERLKAEAGCGMKYLLPDVKKGSACKRLNLFLRWMVRGDEVDPGGWKGIPAAKLIIPLDTHMHRLSRSLGFTRRRQADMRTALEVTRAFREFSPEDPVKYDFALTRLGIRNDTDMVSFLEKCRVCGEGSMFP